MNGKLGIIFSLVAGVLLGGTGMYLARPVAPPQEQADRPPVVVTTVVERVVHAAPATRVIRETGPAAVENEAQQETNPVVAFQPAPGTDTMPARTNRWRDDAATRADWSNREARFRADWTNRAAAARTNFIAKANLNSDQAVRFDVLVSAMNLRLATALDPIIAQYQAGVRPNSEERARVAYNVSGALVNTYDEMNRSMPSDWSDSASSNNISMTQFVDPQYLPFMRGMTGGGGPGGFGRGGGGGPGGGFGGPGGGGGNAPRQAAQPAQNPAR